MGLGQWQQRLPIERSKMGTLCAYGMKKGFWAKFEYGLPACLERGFWLLEKIIVG